jgi:SAM-dependent methyltransferase
VLLVPLLNNGYMPDRSDIREGDRFGALEKLFDAGTIQLLNECGVGGGWHGLEVGAGRGSIAAWLSERVGPTGRVIATDINTQFLDALERPNLEVRQHNIVTDPLSEDTIDLVHVRLVLIRLPERDAVLGRLIKALKPGGWPIDEEFDSLSLRADPDVNPREAVLGTSFAVYRVMADRGAELRFGRISTSGCVRSAWMRSAQMAASRWGRADRRRRVSNGSTIAGSATP